MKITDNIYLDGEELFPDTPIKIIYTGFLVDDSPEAIFMHYGYGLMWDNLQEIKLTKGSKGYESDVTFCEFGEVHFCFRSSNNTWDNNNGQNYQASIEFSKPDIPISDSLALIAMPEPKTGYLIRKKIRITFYRVITFIGKLFSGKILKHN